MARSARPLTGRRVLVTRPQEGSEGLIQRLRSLGATVVHAPTIEMGPPRDPKALRAAVAHLLEFDWLVLTSPTAARRWLDVAGDRLWPQVATVGQGTANVLLDKGYAVTLIAERATGADLARDLITRVGHGRFLLPRSDKALPELPARLRQAGHEVVEVDLYRTVTRFWTPAEAEAAAGADVVLLMSPSAARGLLEQVDVTAWVTQTKLVAMGPTTADEVTKLFGRVDGIAEPPSIAGLVQAAWHVCRLGGPEPVAVPDEAESEPVGDADDAAPVPDDER